MTIDYGKMTKYVVIKKIMTYSYGFITIFVIIQQITAHVGRLPPCNFRRIERK